MGSSAEDTLWRCQFKLRPPIGCGGTGATLEEGQPRQVCWVGQVRSKRQGRVNRASKEMANVRNGICLLLESWVEGNFF